MPPPPPQPHRVLLHLLRGSKSLEKSVVLDFVAMCSFQPVSNTAPHWLTTQADYAVSVLDQVQGWPAAEGSYLKVQTTPRRNRSET